MTTFMYVSSNLVDPEKTMKGMVNQASGVLENKEGHIATDFIAVEEGKTYGIIGPSSYDFNVRYAWYNSEKKFLEGAMVGIGDINYILTAPAGAAYIRFSTGENTLYQPYYFGEDDQKPVFEPYGITYLKREYAPEEDMDAMILNLPSKVYATAGYEMNIYFENLTEDWEKYHWDVICEKGKTMERGYTVIPKEEDAGSYELTVTASLSDRTYKTFKTTLIISPAAAGAGKKEKVIVLGDSTTDNGHAIRKLKENFSSDAMQIITLGTRGTSPDNHEGRSGWRFSSYFAASTDKNVQNPWYDPDKQTFDAAFYFKKSGVEKPDWLFINLGINDTFGFENDTALENGVEKILEQCDAMIASIKAASPETKIGLCMTIPPNHSQDAFGKVYGNGQTRDRYKRNNVYWVSRLIETYDNREGEGLYLVPIYTNLDTVNNMGTEILPVNARNAEATYVSPVANGGVHPVESGYWQIADVYTAFLKAHAND